MKYFNNVKSYQELKEKYRALLKANHPDNGGDLAIMQEINQEYDVAFAIWKNKDVITEEEKKETAQNTRRKFYTDFGWEGSRYDSDLTLKEIAIIIRKYVKEKYPTCKFSIRTKYASMCQELHIELKEFPSQMYKTSDDLRNEGINQHVKIFDEQKQKYCEWDEMKPEVHELFRNMYRHGIFTQDTWRDEELILAYEKALEQNSRLYGIKTEYFQSIINDVNNFVKSYNFEDCDGMIDYFNVNFYFFGVKIDKCVQVERTARLKAVDNKPVRTEEPAETTTETIEQKNYSVQESTHTKTGEKIYLVKWLDTLSRENYIKLNNKIKKLGGYYSKFAHSFIFKTDPSELLKSITIA